MPKRDLALVVAVPILSLAVFGAVIHWSVGAARRRPIVIESTFRASSTEHFKGFELRAIEPRDGYTWSYEFTHNWTPEEPWVTQRAVGRAKEDEQR
jgi:hypothetical protein